MALTVNRLNERSLLVVNPFDVARQVFLALRSASVKGRPSVCKLSPTPAADTLLGTVIKSCLVLIYYDHGQHVGQTLACKQSVVLIEGVPSRVELKTLHIAFAMLRLNQQRASIVALGRTCDPDEDELLILHGREHRIPTRLDQVGNRVADHRSRLVRVTCVRLTLEVVNHPAGSREADRFFFNLQALLVCQSLDVRQLILGWLALTVRGIAILRSLPIGLSCSPLMAFSRLKRIFMIGPTTAALHSVPPDERFRVD